MGALLACVVLCANNSNGSSENSNSSSGSGSETETTPAANTSNGTSTSTSNGTGSGSSSDASNVTDNRSTAGTTSGAYALNPIRGASFVVLAVGPASVTLE